MTKHEILEAIRELKNGKSPGVDQITAEFINLLHTLFNRLFDESTFSVSWTEGVVIPIF